MAIGNSGSEGGGVSILSHAAASRRRLKPQQLNVQLNVKLIRSCHRTNLISSVCVFSSVWPRLLRGLCGDSEEGLRHAHGMHEKVRDEE